MDQDLVIDYCGELHRVGTPDRFVIGRDGDLSVDDDNAFLHRRMVELVHADGLWWVINVGSRLAVTVSGEVGTLHAVIGPGSRLPIVLPTVALLFTAGTTTYEVMVHCGDSPFSLGPSPVETRKPPTGTETLGVVQLTESQLLLIIALAENQLRRLGSGPSELPSNTAAAARLGWSMTTFNRKLDNVCDKFDRAGVKGLRGGPTQHAMQRRARLVEYAIAARVVRTEHLALLDAGRPSASRGD
ncbi:hypothetical protein [Nocardioides sp. AE5]|uniref:hypothetical protein n=1 Tax=Nocardioides sp. AE5 TaxID=2962573 RepID=UPI002881FFE8|nr:hypothetical protein [Nocardioides sp. AE5]MDT0200418.1 hypothetical protein [Nocardioides sp. AE5]